MSASLEHLRGVILYVARGDGTKNIQNQIDQVDRVRWVRSRARVRVRLRTVIKVQGFRLRGSGYGKREDYGQYPKTRTARTRTVLQPITLSFSLDFWCSSGME